MLAPAYGFANWGSALGPPDWLLKADNIPADLDLDFAGNRAWNSGLTTIPGLVSDSRNAIGYASKADGTLQQFSANTLRYNDAGLLGEAEQRTNILTYSQDFTQSAWSKNNVTPTPNAFTAPDGTLTATKLEATASASTIHSHVSVAATSTSMVYFVHLHKGSGSSDGGYAAFRNDSTNTTIRNGKLNFDTGVWTLINGAAPIIEQLAGGWYRLVFVQTTGISIGDMLRGYVGYTGASETAGIYSYAWGAQLEPGAYATSYIPTTSAPVTRAADVITIPLSSLRVPSPSALTLFVDATPLHNQAATNRPVLQFGSSTDDFSSIGSYDSGFSLLQKVGGSSVANVSAGTFAQGSRVKMAARFKSNDFRMSVNGSLTSADTSGAMPSFSGNLLLASGGAWRINRAGVFFDGLPDASLQALAPAP